MTGWNAVLYLENGHVFQGIGHGARKTSGGEAVFNTAMTGYQEVFTDPSYFNQIVVMSYPHIGNTGVNAQDWESKGVFLSGLVVRDLCKRPSSWRSEGTVSDWLEKHSVPVISEVDTRLITEILRDEGSQRAVIFAKDSLTTSPLVHEQYEQLKIYGKKIIDSTIKPMEGLELVSQVSCKKSFEFDPSLQSKDQKIIVVYDYGVKTQILRSFKDLGFKVVVVPYNMPYQEVLNYNASAAVLSNGPGDPEQVKGAVPEIQGLLGKIPILAICMGHQLTARALGAKTYKLPFGHHGVNHPVMQMNSNRVFITSQNHGFSVRAEDLKSKDVTVDYISLNDQTVEGFSSDKLKLCSVQFHPEARPGPREASGIFESFVRGFLK